jgi:hypothetical protein
MALASLPSALSASIKIRAYDASDNARSSNHPITNQVVRSDVLCANGCTPISTQPVESLAFGSSKDVDS